jgi:hypothetical protein
MDGLTFVSNLVESLAWPVAAVWAVYIFRKHIARLVERMTKASGAGIEVEFEKGLEVVGENVARLPPIPASEAKAPYAKEKLREARKLASIAPRAAISEAWRVLEFTILDALTRAGYEIPRAANVVRAVQTTELIPPAAIVALNGLRRLRNSAVHGREAELSEQDALEFVELAEGMVFQIKTGAGTSKAFRGILMGEHGIVIADRLDGQFTVTTAGKETTWSGAFDAGDAAKGLRPGDDYSLAFEDGSQGEILITRVKSPDGLVWFQGSGPPPSKPVN